MLICDITSEYNISGVYKITNIINNKMYIGQAKDIFLRMRGHINHKHNMYLFRAFEKYGLQNFDVTILEKCNCEELNDKEQYWIDYYKSYDKNIGYNICRFAGSTRGRKRTKEEVEKIRKFAKLRVGDKNAFYGKNHSEETKEKIRNKKIGIKFTQEQCKNVSESHIGLKHNEETKQAISNSLTGYKKSKEHIKNMSMSKMGHEVSEETKNKISNSMKNNDRDYSNMSKKVKQINKDTNEVIAIFTSLSEAALHLGHDNCVNIMNVCKKKPHCNTAYGYKWEYA